MNHAGQRAPVSEAQAERAVVQLFELYGWEVRRIREDITRGSVGLPDLLCTSHWTVQLWIEVKRPPSRRNPRGRLRAAQIRTLTEWRRCCVLCLVADDAQDLQALAEKGGRLLRSDGTWALGRHARLDLRGELMSEIDRLMAAYDWWPGEPSDA